MKSCFVKIGRLARRIASYELSGPKLVLWHNDSCMQLNRTEMSTSYEDEFVVLKAKKSRTEVYLPIEHVLPVEHMATSELVEIPFSPEGISCYAGAD